MRTKPGSDAGLGRLQDDSRHTLRDRSPVETVSSHTLSGYRAHVPGGDPWSNGKENKHEPMGRCGTLPQQSYLSAEK